MTAEIKMLEGYIRRGACFLYCRFIYLRPFPLAVIAGSRLHPSQRKERLGESVGWPVCIHTACTTWVEGLEPNKTTAKKRGTLPINLV